MKRIDMETDRIERLLVSILLQAMKESSQAEKIHQLNIAGFSNIQIAEFLQTTPSTVAVQVHHSKKSRRSRS